MLGLQLELTNQRVIHNRCTLIHMQRIKIHLFLVVIFSSTITLSQTYSAQIPDSIILNFMDWELKNGQKFAEGGKLRFRKKTSCKILKMDALNFVYPDSLSTRDWQYRLFLFNRYTKIDTLFSETEIESLFIQFNALKDTVWSHKIRGANIKKGTIRRNYYSYSIPIFTPDFTFVFLNKTFYCGSVCAYGGVYLYKKNDENSWELVTILNGWMS